MDSDSRQGSITAWGADSIQIESICEVRMHEFLFLIFSIKWYEDAVGFSTRYVFNLCP